jgi:hypothetical protein
MYSAFSFGKILKTILPGSVLAGALFLLGEILFFLNYRTSLVETIVAKEAGSLVGAALVPISLVFGFMLNTFVWMYLNSSIRKQVDAELAPTPYKQLRDALCERMRREIEMEMGPARAQLCSGGWPDRLTLEYYYLPAVTVEHLTYLWESYFSWYEFHLNTLYALVVLCGMAIVLLFVRAPLPTWQLVMLAALLAAASVATCRMLHKSAIRNMVSYEKNLVVMISRAIRPAATP